MLSDVSRPVRIEPGPGQESVWDYPRPPRVEPCCRTGWSSSSATGCWPTPTRALRVLETSQPPAFYLPPDDVDLDLLEPTATRTWCEWKGEADYFTVRAGGRRRRRRGLDATATRTPASRPSPTTWRSTRQLMDACFVDDEQVSAGEGSFYGGWITSNGSSGRSRVRPAPCTGERRAVRIRVLSVFEGVVYHCWPIDLTNPEPSGARGRGRAPRG